MRTRPDQAPRHRVVVHSRGAIGLRACVVSRTGDQLGGGDVTRRWTLRLGAGLVVAATLVTGCSEKHEASKTLPTSRAVESTPELPPLGPDDMPMPEEARTQDAAGAEAFVHYYFDLLNRSLNDMDPQYLRFFAREDCRTCERIATETEDDAA